MSAPAALSAEEARWLALAAQGLDRVRPTRADVRHLRRAVETMGVVQLDAINVVARTQYLVPFSRVGAYDRARLEAMNGPRGELLEGWAHAAAWVPMGHEPLLRWKAELARSHGATEHRRAAGQAFHDEHRAYIDAVLAEVGDRGPISAGQLRDPRRQTGEWWQRRSLGRRVLEFLFGRGELAAWRTSTFERVYDVPERVIPPDVLARPTPTPGEAQRQLLALAARSLGVATVADLADYYRIPARVAALRVAELVDDGQLVAVDVEGWTDVAFALPRARPRPPSRTEAALLSPFDPLVWYRPRARRLFDLDYTIEVYTPAPRRRFGYYVMPVLVGDRIVGRLDPKADRTASVLRIRAAHLEPGLEAAEVVGPIAEELVRLAGWLGLGSVAIEDRGDMAPALRSAVS